MRVCSSALQRLTDTLGELLCSLRDAAAEQLQTLAPFTFLHTNDFSEFQC